MAKTNEFDVMAFITKETREEALIKYLMSKPSLVRKAAEEAVKKFLSNSAYDLSYRKGTKKKLANELAALESKLEKQYIKQFKAMAETPEYDTKLQAAVDREVRDDLTRMLNSVSHHAFRRAVEDVFIKKIEARLAGTIAEYVNDDFIMKLISNKEVIVNLYDKDCNGGRR